MVEHLSTVRLLNGGNLLHVVGASGFGEDGEGRADLVGAGHGAADAVDADVFAFLEPSPGAGECTCGEPRLPLEFTGGEVESSAGGSQREQESELMRVERRREARKGA